MNVNKKKYVEEISDLPDFKFKGNKPAIIKFETNGCVPCKLMKPILETFEKSMENELNVYVINAEEENELANVFNVTSVPTLVFVDKNGKHTIHNGQLTLTGLKEKSHELLGV
jgi:thiol-disulfide isomerase/thioredoxin